MTRKQKKTLWRIIFSFVLLAAAALLPEIEVPFNMWPYFGQPLVNEAGEPYYAFPRLYLFLIPYLVIGWDVLWRAVRNIKNGQVFDENFLMSVATVGAMSVGEYAEGVAVMVFYQVGELFQNVAVSRSRQSISELMDIRPDYANVEREGQLVQVDPEEVQVDDIIVIKAGERVPLDGTVTQGSSALDTAALTGESLPRDVEPGDEVISGCVNLSGLLHVKVSKPYGQSTVARILDLVENSSEKKAQAEHFITKFARYYTQSCQQLTLQRFNLGHQAAASLPADWPVGGVGPPCPELPGRILPMRPGHLHSPVLFWRAGRSVQAGYPGEGEQLSGGPGQYRNRGAGQDRHSD